jgi:cysteine synthase/rhodanese-related sulfurtransferase
LEVSKGNNILLEHFEQEIWSKVPHLEETKIVNATPLTDLTEDLKECAKSVYKADFTDTDLKVFGKFDSNLLTGSIKIRAAVHIIHNAIVTGKLKSGQTVIEATSGNFGIALGLLSKLGLVVISLVSRKLQEGVFKELRNENIRIIDLDMDICPAPGMKDGAADLLTAKATAANIRSQLSELGFDSTIFDKENSEIESLLVKQDIINLAKFLAKIYGLFCPEQYDNELNIDVHRTVTAAEIDQQLHENDNSLEDFEIVCTFGTGGTSGGLSRYVSEKYGKKSVHVVFPPAGQDVAGIRTKDKASGLKLYEPEKYAGEHEVDFEQAKYLLKFFVDKGHDIGESTALALYQVLVMANSSGGGKFVVIVADGIEKYRKNLEAMSKNQRVQVSLDEAVTSANDYDRIIWVHTQYTPREEGIELIAKSLGVDKSKISVPKARTIEQLLSTQQIPEELSKDLQGSKGKSLLICMAGNTSLMATKVLATKGIVTESLTGGITELPEGKSRDPSEFIKVATE